MIELRSNNDITEIKLLHNQTKSKQVEDVKAILNDFNREQKIDIFNYLSRDLLSKY